MNDNPYLTVVVAQLIIYGVPALFYSRIRGRELTLRLRLPKMSHILYILYAIVFLVTSVVLVSMLMYKLSPLEFEVQSVTEQAAFAMNGGVFDVLYLIVAFAVLPAVTEELLFRGIVIGEYQNKGVVIAVVISSMMFAMSHFSWVYFPVYFVSGLILGSAAFTTRSIIATMIIHTANNAAVLLSEKYIIYISDRQNISSELFVIIAVLIAVISATLMCYEAHHIYRAYSDANIEPEYSFKNKNLIGRIGEVFFSPTFLLLVIIFAVVTTMKI